MITLPNGCWCGPISVHPKNWKTLSASVKKSWYIHYKFYDPAFKTDSRYKKGKLVIVKGGMNFLNTRQERRDKAQSIIAVELDLLQNEGYNPITGQYNPPPKGDFIISPQTDLISALKRAMELKDCTKETKLDIKSMLLYFTAAAKKSGLQTLAVTDTRRKHIRAVLEQCGIDKKVWNAARFNRYRSYLKGLFDELIEFEAIDHNPVTDLKKKQTVKKIRQVLTDEELIKVDRHLKKKKLNRFRLFIRIFFHSGARITELLNLKGNQVNLTEQYFIVTIKKGKECIEVKKTIRNVALRYWKMAMANCGQDDYVFGKGLKPCSAAITRAQVTRRWEMHVKAELGITADFYSYKHKNSTATSNKYGEIVAAAQNSHTTTAMVVNIYDLKNKERNHEELKKVDVAFVN